MRIGILDSGLGGLSVLHCAEKIAPEHDYIFYADRENVPYGEKTVEEVRVYVDKIIKFMIGREVDLIIIACNTATSSLSMAYRKQFSIPIVGMEPAVKRAIDLYGDAPERILLAATPITIHGNKLDHLIQDVDHFHKVDLVAAPGLVRFAENSVFSGNEVCAYLNTCLKEYDLQKYGTVVLGCTHFNYFKEAFMEVFPHKPHFVDGNEGTVKQAMRLLAQKDKICTRQGKIEYLFSGKQATDEDMKKITNCMTQLDKMINI